MAPPADMMAIGASPFHDFAFCDVMLGCVAAPASDPKPACFFDDTAAPAAPAPTSSGGSSFMDHDNNTDQVCDELDSLLAAAARKPSCGEQSTAFVTPALAPAARAVAGVYGACRIADGTPAGIAAAAANLIQVGGGGVLCWYGCNHT